jgi:tetratricopeptide (TPR) repeat protein
MGATFAVRRISLSPLVLFALSLALPRGPAVAAEPPSAGAADLAKARADYEVGTRYYDLGQYEKALDAYRSAYASRPDPALLFNVAQCLRKLKRPGEALDIYRTYLRRAPRSPKRADVERIMKTLEDELAAAPPTAPPPIQTAPPPLSPLPSSQAAPAAAVSAPAPSPETNSLLHRPWFWGVAAVVAAGAATSLLLVTRSTERTIACDGCIGSHPVPAR